MAVSAKGLSVNPGLGEAVGELAAPPAAPPSASQLKAWCYLVWLCLQRQARAPQMVWIAVALLGLTMAVVGLNTLGQRWEMAHWRYPRNGGPTFDSWVEIIRVLPMGPSAAAVKGAYAGASRVLMRQTGFYVFANGVVFSVFLSFLLPIWSLSFATHAIGGEREARTLVWLLNQPLPRPLIYLAKFIALLPFALGLNLGGFALLCLVAGRAGRLALPLFWPAVALGTLAFCSLFHLLGAWFRRAAVIGLVYSFFLEMIVGNMPGYMKRVSIGFFTRCMMFAEAEGYAIQPEKPSIYLPVDGRTAAWVLAGITVLCLGLGMVIFSRSEYHDLT
jgi:ABC-type transport system involved in multi-copper enzyme maturation permease subunit